MSPHTGSFSQCALEAAASQIELRPISWLEDVQHHLAWLSHSFIGFYIFQSWRLTCGCFLCKYSLPGNTHPSRLTHHSSRHFDICLTPPTTCIRTEGSWEEYLCRGL
ncbi:unnamed protein product [Staurois parvus]|uniref:Uncharacterized protein n=1 Tax=Staurois parvus TaxID=386267 RepID=A0ABN9BGW4_9NEOB|nr:unnamed protein product [Staurois parvus]